MMLRPEKDETASTADTSESDAAVSKSEGLHPNGALFPLVETADAGAEYLDSLTILCDSSFAGLRSAGLTDAAVWSSESCYLPMNECDKWEIRYPGDGSLISPSSAALVAKPGIVVIAVGSDGLEDCSRETFISQYEALIRGIANASPKARVVCLSVCSVTTAYTGGYGLSREKAAEVNGWIKTVCVDTGAYFGDLSSTLCIDGYLRADYADGSGRALNNAGLREVLNYLRDHSVDAQ